MASDEHQPVIGQYMYIPSTSPTPVKSDKSEIADLKIVTSAETSHVAIKPSDSRSATISPLSPEECDANLEYMLTIDLPDSTSCAAADAAPKKVSESSSKSMLSAK